MLQTGEVVPCPQDWYRRIPLGDLREESLPSIWNGDPIRALRGRHARMDLAGLVPCEECDRVRRKTVLGVPTENLRSFSAEQLAGYNWVGGLIRK